MSSSGLAKFGPQQVDISPSCDSVSCAFDFEKGLAGTGITLKCLCHAGPNPFRQTAYLVSQGKKRAVAVVADNSGSGGDSTNVTVHFTVNQAAQDWCAEARAME